MAVVNRVKLTWFAAMPAQPSIGRIVRHGKRWRARRYHLGRQYTGPSRATYALARADLPSVHVDQVRAAMYRDANQAVGAVDVHGSGFRARVARMKGRVRATEAEALADLGVMRCWYWRSGGCGRSGGSEVLMLSYSCRGSMGRCSLI